jgi:hypothetical protein
MLSDKALTELIMHRTAHRTTTGQGALAINYEKTAGTGHDVKAYI